MFWIQSISKLVVAHQDSVFLNALKYALLEDNFSQELHYTVCILSLLNVILLFSILTRLVHEKDTLMFGASRTLILDIFFEVSSVENTFGGVIDSIENETFDAGCVDGSQ